MSISFAGSELIDVAIDIERRGIAFYDTMARSTEDVGAREVFNYLADMERGHMQIFQGMLDEAGEYQPPQSQTEEYAAYLKALVNSAVFSDDMVDSQAVSQADTDVKAIELAIGAEKDSILFYSGMKEIMPKPAQATVDKIISEEKSHLRQLSELKKRLGTSG